MKFESTKPTKAVIFDFDGTLADSFDVFLEALVTITKRSEKLTAEEIKYLRESSTREVIKKLNIKPWQVPLLLVKGRREISRRIEKLKAFRDVPEMIQQLSAQYSVYILSTNSEENIASFLKAYQLNDFVTKVYGNVGLAGKAKGLKKLQKRETLQASDCLYVGDEIRDIEAARKVGMKCIVVKWGYNDPDTLRSFAPNALAKTPQDLLDISRSQMT